MMLMIEALLTAGHREQDMLPSVDALLWFELCGDTTVTGDISLELERVLIARRRCRLRIAPNFMVSHDAMVCLDALIASCSVANPMRTICSTTAISYDTERCNPECGTLD